MNEEVIEKTSFISATSIVTLIVGLTSIAVSLFIFYASRERPSIIIDQLPAISYASPATLSSIGQVILTVNGAEVENLQGIPFRIKNSGNQPVSSLQGSKAFNLTGPVVLSVSSPLSGQVLAVESTPGDLSIETLTKQDKDNYTIQLSIKNLNPGSTADFTVMYAGESTPSFSLLGNPLVGGTIELLKNSLPTNPTSTWEKFKSVWLAQSLGFLFLGQVPIIIIILAAGARQKWLEEKQDAKGIQNNSLEEGAKKEQKEKIKADVEEKLKMIDPETIKILKSTRVPVPINFFDEKEASMSLFDIFAENFNGKWEWVLTDKYPLPQEFNIFSHRPIITSWLDWGDFIKSFVLPLGIPSIVLGVLGYALLYL